MIDTKLYNSEKISFLIDELKARGLEKGVPAKQLMVIFLENRHLPKSASELYYLISLMEAYKIAKRIRKGVYDFDFKQAKKVIFVWKKEGLARYGTDSN